MRLPDSTLTGFESRRQQRVAAWGRRATLGIVFVFVAAGVCGLLGIRTATVAATAGGYHLEVEHAAVARAGLDVPWQVRVESETGFGDSITLAVTGDYFDLYETQGFTPEPAASMRDEDTLYLVFDSPAGDTFVLDYDAYIQPSSQRGGEATVAVVDAGRRPIVSVAIDTVLLP